MATTGDCRIPSLNSTDRELLLCNGVAAGLSINQETFHCADSESYHSRDNLDCNCKAGSGQLIDLRGSGLGGLDSVLLLKNGNKYELS